MIYYKTKNNCDYKIIFSISLEYKKTEKYKF